MSDPPHGALPPNPNGEVANLNGFARKRIGQELRTHYALPVDADPGKRINELLLLLERDEQGGLSVKDDSSQASE